MPHRVIVFDVNETLLDLSGLDPVFEEVFGSAEIKSQWFSSLLILAMTSALTGVYRDFSEQGRAALGLVAARHKLELSEDQIGRIVEQMKHLPPHADARPALERLKEAGFRLAALTNSAPPVAQTQLGNAGLAPDFEAILSVDEARCFKPAHQPYRMAARRLGVKTSDIRMVAVHDWDIAGAMAADCQGAFVARGGIGFNPLMPKPDIIASTLLEVAEGIIQKDG